LARFSQERLTTAGDGDVLYVTHGNSSPIATLRLIAQRRKSLTALPAGIGPRQRLTHAHLGFKYYTFIATSKIIVFLFLQYLVSPGCGIRPKALCSRSPDTWIGYDVIFDHHIFQLLPFTVLLPSIQEVLDLTLQSSLANAQISVSLFPVASTLKHRASVKRFVPLQFLNPKTVGRTPWTGDQPVARTLPTQTQNKRRHTTMP
jgi:hypothetical protein